MRLLSSGWALLALVLFGFGGLLELRYEPGEVDREPWLRLAALDTVTYGDARIVYKLPTDTSRNAAGDLRRLPDLSAAPTGARFRVIWKPETYDSVLVVTGDTFALSPVDSATVTSIAAAWGVTDPANVVLAWHVPPGTAPDPVTGLLLAMLDDTLSVSWNESADDYEVLTDLVAGGNASTDTVAAPPFKRELPGSGDWSACVRAFDGAAISSAVCDEITYIAGGGTLAGGDLGSTYGMTVQDSANVALLVGFPYLGFPVDSTTVPLLGFEQGDVWWNFEKWADTMYVTLHDDAASGYSAIYDHQHWDRAKSLYSYFWMTGQHRFKRQADSTLWMAFDNYYRTSSSGFCHIPPQRMLPEGMWVYVFTHQSDPDSAVVGDSMRYCNQRISERLRSVWIDDYNDPTNQYDDSRIQARTSQWAMTMALFDSVDYAGRDWQALGPVLGYDSLMSFHELKATATPGVMHLDSYGGCAPPWQLSASPLHVLMDRERWIGGLTGTQSDSIATTVGGLADTLANTSGLYLASSGTYNQKGFKYQVGCGSESGAGSVALNGLVMLTLAHEFRATGDSAYWHWAVDSLLQQNHEYGLFCGGNPGPCGTVPGGRNWWYGRGSEFNEAFYALWESLILLDEGT